MAVVNGLLRKMAYEDGKNSLPVGSCPSALLLAEEP
jgi:hypothetical protein